MNVQNVQWRIQGPLSILYGCWGQIMVDDVAVVVIMLTQPPRSAVHISQPPPGAVRAGTCNAAANSAEAKAARDVLASLPYQNLFRHLQLVRFFCS